MITKCASPSSKKFASLLKNMQIWIIEVYYVETSLDFCFLCNFLIFPSKLSHVIVRKIIVCYFIVSSFFVIWICQIMRFKPKVLMSINMCLRVYLFSQPYTYIRNYRVTKSHFILDAVNKSTLCWKLLDDVFNEIQLV